MTDLGPFRKTAARRHFHVLDVLLAVATCVVIGAAVGDVIGGGGGRVEVACALSALVGAAVGLELYRSADGHRVSELHEAFPPELPADTRATIDDLLTAGRRAEAVKTYRVATGASLRDAARAIDRRQAQA